MAVANWIIDKSAYTRLSASPDAQAWIERIERGLVRISTITKLEIVHSFQTGHQARYETAAPPLVLMPVEYLTPAAEDRAIEVEMLLADSGQHRVPAIPDLLIAATAELANLTVLALATDFNLIAQVTGQPVERLRQ